MHNLNNNKKNTRRTVTVTLKDGTSITLQEHDRFTVRGQMAYSHMTRPLSAQEIERKNDRRNEWATKEERPGPFYPDDPSKPYVEVTIKNADIVSKYPGKTTNAERFVKDHFFESIHFDHGVKKLNLKNFVATVSTGVMDEEGQVTQYLFEDELEIGSEVVCEGMVYISKTGKAALAVTSVYTIGEPIYFDWNRYKKSTTAA